jgi:hypothetical protein
MHARIYECTRENKPPELQKNSEKIIFSPEKKNRALRKSGYFL